MNIETQEKLIRVAMQEAEKAIKQGNSPFGAVLADKQGNILATAYNTVYTDSNPTAHAEINLIQKFCKENSTRNLSEFILVSNAQSCAMCFSAAVRSKITNFIYGYAEDETLVPKIDVLQLSKYCEQKINIIGNVLSDECKEQINKIRNK